MDAWHKAGFRSKYSSRVGCLLVSQSRYRVETRGAARWEISKYDAHKRRKRESIETLEYEAKQMAADQGALLALEPADCVSTPLH